MFVPPFIQLRADSALRQRFAENGRAYAKLHFNKHRVLRDYDSLVSGCAQNHGKKQEVTKEAAVAR